MKAQPGRSIMPDPLPDKSANIQNTAAADLIDSLVCPGCNATLYKVSAAPGAKVRCLHCGARFLPAPREGGAAASLSAPTGREPHSPGYFLLRIPAVVWIVAALVFTGVVGWNLLGELLRGFNTSGILMGFLYLPLALLSGGLFFVWTRSLARIDAAMVRLAWKEGRVREPLPAPEGSSLPYIAPLAIAGGMIPVAMFALSGDTGASVAGAIMGAVAFYFGFAAEDLRQFAWRQRQLAAPLSQFRWRTPAIAIAFACGFGCLFLLEAYAINESWSRSYRQSELPVYAISAALAAGLAVTSYFVVSGWELAAEYWTFGRSQDRAPLMQWLIRGPLFWLGFTVLWFLVMLLDRTGPRETLPFFLMLLTFVALTIGLSQLLSRVSAWASAVCRAHAGKSAHTPAAPAGLALTMMRITMVLAVVQSVAFAWMLLSEMGSRRSGEQLGAIVVAMGIVHYPTLWVAAVVGEFIRVEQSCTAAARDEFAD